MTKQGPRTAEKLPGFQRKHLRGLAHGYKPLVWIGQRGVTAETLAEIDHALLDHELIKVKFNAFKEKVEKAERCEEIAQGTSSELVGLIGHTAIFYRPHPEADQRKIRLLKRSPNRTGS